MFPVKRSSIMVDAMHRVFAQFVHFRIIRPFIHRSSSDIESGEGGTKPKFDLGSCLEKFESESERRIRTMSRATCFSYAVRVSECSFSIVSKPMEIHIL